MVKGINVIRKNIASFLVFFFVAGFITLSTRIVWLQFVDGKKMTDRVRSQLIDNRALSTPRGTIYDRKGRELAVSIRTKSLYANPKELNKAPEVVANLLANILQVSATDIKERLTVDGSFIWLKRRLDPEDYKAVEAILKENDIHGLSFSEETKRYYPNDTLAAHVLGFVGTDDNGLEGIEMSEDKLLRGQEFKQALETDIYGIPIFKSIFFKSQYQGKSLTLTIDSNIQFIVEQSLDNAVAKTGAKGATVIIMNPKTGEILALSNRPTYNPNQFFKSGDLERKNRAVANIYEPGSTFKAVIAAAALQENIAHPDDVFVDKGYIEVSGRRIRNWSGDAYGKVTFTEVIKNSINTGFAEVGLWLGATRLTNYARVFGFGKATGIELSGELDGILFNPVDMQDADVATMSIGQSIAVTPLQLITAISAIANDGVLLKPHIIKEIRNADGTVMASTEIQPIRQAITPQVAQQLKGLLEKVVSEGGGKKGRVKGYRFAGKTGTAERLRDDGTGYEAGRYIASFVGFGPVEEVQVAAIVVLDSPVGSYYGGEIAAPVFNEIMTKVMRYLNILPNDLNFGLPNSTEQKAGYN